MPKRPLPRWLQSSVDPTKVSLTIKGLAFFVPSVVAIAGYFGLHLSTESIMEGVTQLAAIGSGVAMLWGIVRKIVAGGDDPA